VTVARSDAGVASILHAQGADAWEAAVRHPMVIGIADGSLPHETFRRYFTQNVLYLEEYARAIGIIVGKAPDRDAVTTLTRFLARIVENEIPSNLSFLERLGGDPDTVAGRGAMLPVTYGYTRHLLSVCALGDCADGLTAVLPCQWSYGELARPLAAHPPADRHVRQRRIRRARCADDGPARSPRRSIRQAQDDAALADLRAVHAI